MPVVRVNALCSYLKMLLKMLLRCRDGTSDANNDVENEELKRWKGKELNRGKIYLERS